jgi:membrane-bound lytic murein transglycosylase D
MRVFVIFIVMVLAIGWMNTASAQETPLNDPIEEMLDSLCVLEGLNECAPTSDEALAGFNLSNELIRARMLSRLSPIPFEMNEQVRRYIELYAIRRKELVRRVLGMAEMYFPMFEEVLDRQGLPLELKYLAVVESALNPVAVSRAGATGIWQFMYHTARLYGLQINSYVDERRDPLKATYAMTRYFKEMYALYNDWLLAIAAYNCGPNNVNKAILRSGGKINFWEIAPYLPAETRGYVPAFLAVSYIMQFADLHDITPIPFRYSYYNVDTVIIVHGVNLSRIATLLDMSYHEIRYLNPSYKKGIIPAGYRGVLRIPKSRMDEFIARYENIPLENEAGIAPILAKMNLRPDGTPAEGFQFVDVTLKKIHHVKKGETLHSIALQYNSSIADLKRLNKLRHTSLKAGQKLTVLLRTKKLSPIQNVSGESAGERPDSQQDVSLMHASTDTSAEVKIIYHTVEKGDTLWNISKRYGGVTIDHLMKLNKLNHPSELQPGKKIKIPVGG